MLQYSQCCLMLSCCRASNKIFTSSIVDSCNITYVGVPPPVVSLSYSTSDDHVHLSWTSSNDTLPIAGFDMGTKYCVDVLNLSSTSRLLHSKCGINTTEFTYTLPSSWCHVYAFRVIPVNPAGNGTQKTIKYPSPSEYIFIRMDS